MASRYLDRARSVGTKDPNTLTDSAELHAMQGQAKDAVEVTKKSFATGYRDHFFPVILPGFQPIRRGPEFTALLRASHQRVRRCPLSANSGASWPSEAGWVPISRPSVTSSSPWKPVAIRSAWHFGGKANGNSQRRRRKPGWGRACATRFAAPSSIPVEAVSSTSGIRMATTRLLLCSRILNLGRADSSVSSCGSRLASRSSSRRPVKALVCRSPTGRPQLC
jgi:hypothetical protein